ncbi:hypothetical protein ABR855_12235 [Aeromonas hydrophila]|uniref:hypothetical protein n=1 Tax=Aeromonas hydrophila TaxID=644 RepID=UPI00330689BB
MIKQGTYDFDIYRGDSSVYEMQFTNTDNVTGEKRPVDLSYYNITAEVRYTYDQDSVWINLNPVVIDAKNGHIRIILTSGTTANALPPSDPLAPAVGVWDLQLVDKTDPQKVFSPMVGTLKIRKDVTRKN